MFLPNLFKFMEFLFPLLVHHDLQVAFSELRIMALHLTEVK